MNADPSPALSEDADRQAEALYHAAQIAADLLQRRTDRHDLERVGVATAELERLDDETLQRRWLAAWNRGQQEYPHMASSNEARRISVILQHRGYVRPHHRYTWERATPLSNDGVIERRDAAKTVRKLEEWNEDI